jgi:antitoxin component YwqK of YwqJK toxin-antitoxin module
LEIKRTDGSTFIKRIRLSNPRYSFDLSLSPEGDTLLFDNTTEKKDLSDGYFFNQKIYQNKTKKITVNHYVHKATAWYHQDLLNNKIYQENGNWKIKRNETIVDGRLQRSVWMSKIHSAHTRTQTIHAYYSEPDVKVMDSKTKTDSAHYILDGKALQGEVHFIKGKKNRIKQQKGITIIETKEEVWNIYNLIAAKGSFENGIKTDLWVYQYSNGDELHCSYQQGKLNGSYLLFDTKSRWDEEELELARSCGIENKKLKYPRLHVSLKNGFSDGDAVVLDFTGTVLISAEFKNGQLHGKLETVNILGRNLIRANYRDGKLDGAFHAELIQYNPESIRKSKAHDMNTKGTVNCNFVHDSIHGKFLLQIKNQPIIEGEVNKNLAVGQWKVFHYNNKFSGVLHFTTELTEEDSLDVKKETFEYFNRVTEIFLPTNIFSFIKELKRIGHVKVFGTDGKLLNEIKGNKVQYLSSVLYYPSGKLSQSLEFFPRTTKMYASDSSRIIGKVTSYFENGKVWSVGVFSQYSFDNDCEGGVEILIPKKIHYTELYDQTGKAMLINGNGYCMFYDYKGILREEGEMLQHQRNGQWKIYDKNGKASEIGHYLNGKKNGIWITGDLTGIHSLSEYCLDENNPELKSVLEKELAHLNFTVEYFEHGESVQYQSTHVDTYNYIWPSKKAYKKRNEISYDF